jgi:hypothetical protein
MNDDFDGDTEDNEIPDDMTDDIQEQIDQAVEDRIGDVYEDARPRSGGCLLILALPVLGLWLMG